MTAGSWRLMGEWNEFGGTMNDWTVGVHGSNSSARFQGLVDTVARIIRDDAHTLLSGRTQDTARLIVAKLAHEHGLAPGDSASAHAYQEFSWSTDSLRRHLIEVHHAAGAGDDTDLRHDHRYLHVEPAVRAASDPPTTGTNTNPQNVCIDHGVYYGTCEECARSAHGKTAEAQS